MHERHDEDDLVVYNGQVLNTEWREDQHDIVDGRLGGFLAETQSYGRSYALGVVALNVSDKFELKTDTICYAQPQAQPRNLHI